jgi:hypothetical protein
MCKFCWQVLADRLTQLRQLAKEQADLEKKKLLLLNKLQSEVSQMILQTKAVS